MQKETEEILSELLKMTPERLSGDISQLSDMWESILKVTLSPTVHQATISVLLLCKAYLRGYGIRMGNWKTFQTHGFKAALLSTAILKYVAKEGKIMYPRLHKLGFTSLENATRVMKLDFFGGAVAEAEQILRDKQQKG